MGLIFSLVLQANALQCSKRGMSVEAYTELLFLFFIYSFLGWCTEVIYATLNRGVFVNRGFLTGPICPIYGVGIVVVLYVLHPIKENLFFLFIGSVFLTTIIELITGLILEKFFKQKWWDYSDELFNFKGYISLKFSLQWGIACVLIVRVIHPLIIRFLSVIPEIVLFVFLILVSVSFVTDVIFTILTMLKIRKRIIIEHRLHEILKKESYLIGENISDVVVTLMRLYDKTYKGSQEGVKRLAKAFPGINILKEKNKELVERIKKLLR